MKRGRSTPASHEPELTLNLLPGSIEFVVGNPTSDPIRIWDRDNSWGWPTLELDVAAETDDDSFHLVPKPRRWTRNFPRAIEIEPGRDHTFVVPADRDPSWAGLEHLGHLQYEPMRVRGSLHIPPSVEAEQDRVFVGVISSPPVLSTPPHDWLVVTWSPGGME